MTQVCREPNEYYTPLVSDFVSCPENITSCNGNGQKAENNCRNCCFSNVVNETITHITDRIVTTPSMKTPKDDFQYDRMIWIAFACLAAILVMVVVLLIVRARIRRSKNETNDPNQLFQSKPIQPGTSNESCTRPPIQEIYITEV